jgi:hypothetical protein
MGKEPPTSTRARRPNRIPAGLSRKRSAPGIAERTSPSIVDGDPPVTRAMTWRMAAGPVNVALCPGARSNRPKL